MMTSSIKQIKARLEKINTYIPLFQIFRFGMVGLLAAAIHFTVVVYLVQIWHFVPLTANIFGFVVSFQMSYWGHRLWTFNHSAALHRVVFPKLLLVQVMNLAANESLFYLFLTFNLPYPIALLIVLTILPIFTFLSSKWWVFKA
jgi:putative flippase GtrA